MDLQKWIDERTDEELPAVLSGVVRKMTNGHANSNGSFPICDSSGTTVGYFVLAEHDDTDSEEDIAELEWRMEFDGPTISAEEAAALLEHRWGKKSRPRSPKLPDPSLGALNNEVGS